MLKRIVILAILSSILIVLVLVKSHSVAPVDKTSTNAAQYTTLEYKISDIKGNQYYGKSEDGTGIQFSADKIVSGDKINVDDEVICYFEKDNLGKGIVKVEKK
ncbi:hypothetical protein V7161_07390 [Neobacillus drentensis]|uniref:hypothetical protein n=1 Tax=Bacillales TaxID=1385 RepID=UPI0025B03C44|nr:hypothetical protein [Paenibacillus sp. BSR1-1]MDN3019600.1 hypothetical protein [Paenibacillus sp. BSR1-1]